MEPFYPDFRGFSGDGSGEAPSPVIAFDASHTSVIGFEQVGHLGFGDFHGISGVDDAGHIDGPIRPHGVADRAEEVLPHIGRIGIISFFHEGFGEVFVYVEIRAIEQAFGGGRFSLVEGFEPEGVKFSFLVEQGEGVSFGPEGFAFPSRVQGGRGGCFHGLEVEAVPDVGGCFLGVDGRGRSCERGFGKRAGGAFRKRFWRDFAKGWRGQENFLGQILRREVVEREQGLCLFESADQVILVPSG